MWDIHNKDVQQLLKDSRDLIEEKRAIFEKYKPMSDLISTIQAKENENQSTITEMPLTCMTEYF